MAATTTRIYELQVKLAQESLRSLKSLEKHAADANRKMDLLTEGAKGLAQGLAAGFTVDAFITGISNAITYVDDLAAAAERVGVSAESFSKLSYAAEQTDVSLGSLEKGMRQLQKSIVDTGSKGGKLLEALDIDTTQEIEKVMQDLAGALEGIQDPAQKTATMLGIFGKSGADLKPLMNQGAEGMAELTAEAERLGLVVSNDTADALGELDNQFNKVTAQTQAMFVQLAEGLAPSLIEVTQAFIDSSASGDKFKQVGEVLGVVIRGLANGAAILASTFELAGNTIGMVAASAAAAITGDFSGAMAILEEGALDNQKVLTDLADTITDLSTDTESHVKTVEEEVVVTEKQIEQQREVAAILDSTTAKTEKNTKAKRENKKATEEMLPGEQEWLALQKEGVALTESVRTSYEVLQDNFSKYNELLDRGVISQETYNRAVREAAGSYQTAEEGARKTTEAITGTDAILDNIANALPQYGKDISGALIDFATNADNASLSFSDMAESVLRDLAKMVTQVLVVQPLMDALKASLTSGAGAGAGAGAGGFLASVFGSMFGSAKGNVFAGGSLVPFAKGGVVTTPTVFPMANGGVGLMGEAGTEAVMPLARDSQGRLGVSGGGSSVTVNVINNAGADVSVEQQSGPNGEQVLQIMVERAVSSAISKGRFDSSFQAAYGLNRKGR